jgi:hypothetical protein
MFELIKTALPITNIYWLIISVLMLMLLRLSDLGIYFLVVLFIIVGLLVRVSSSVPFLFPEHFLDLFLHFVPLFHELHHLCSGTYVSNLFVCDIIWVRMVIHLLSLLDGCYLL